MTNGHCPVCGKTDRPIFGAIFASAMIAANKNNQTVGEKHDLFVTLEQLQEIMRRIVQEESQ